MTDRARISDANRASDGALRRGLNELRCALPSPNALRAAFNRLETELGDDARDVEADSGVRPAPWAHEPERAQNSSAERAPLDSVGLAVSVANAGLLAPARRLPAPARRLPVRALLGAAALLSCAAMLAVWGGHGRSVSAAVPSPGAPWALVGAAQVVSTHHQGGSGSTSPLVVEQETRLSHEDAMPIAVATRSANRPAARRRVEIATAEAGDDAATGVLNINSIPFSRVVLDGRPLGETPRVQIAVSAGVHTVLFVHPEYGRISREVRVDAGRPTLAAVRFTQLVEDAPAGDGRRPG